MDQFSSVDVAHFITVANTLKKAPRPPPTQLLIAVASCYGAPGTSFTIEDAIPLLKKAISRKLSEEGVQRLRSLYRLLGKTEEQMYWQNVLKEIEGKLPPPPSFLTLALEELENIQEC